MEIEENILENLFTSEADAARAPIDVEFTCLPAINFSMQEHKVAVIRRFSIENQTDSDLTDIQITLTSEPEFAETVIRIVKVIPANSILKIDDLRLTLSTNFFTRLTERLAGSLRLEIAVADDILFSESYPVSLLVFDQWPGVMVLPEMLSAFVTPDHPALESILKRASAILERWTGSRELDEYQSRNPNRVRKQMAAVYTAIAEHNIACSAAPANFENQGLRIRLVNTVLSQKMGTCLDMALLYASCLEAIGIHPLIVIVRNHAFAGGWLIPDTFLDTITDDISFLTKRIADGINEITLVEATGMNQNNDMNFEQAVTAADDCLIDESGFVLAIDIKRCRLASIHPLPPRIGNAQQGETLEAAQTTDKSNVKIGNVNPYDLSGISSKIEMSKQLFWERKLLDLSLRNNLLNIRITKKTLQLISASLDTFEDAVAAGDEFRIMPRPADCENPVYNFGIYHLPSESPVIELVKSEMLQKRLRSYLPEIELAKALTYLYRFSRLSIEENGANTLYIALGLLKWFETPNSERPRYAPILLLPVEIIRKSAAQGYVIRARDEDTIINITLLEMLRQNFGITVLGLDPLPQEEHGVDVRLIFSIFRNSIINRRKWDVEEQAILGIFSFNKFIMWNDIHNNSHKLAENKLVSSLINGKIEWEIKDNTVNAAVLDKELSPADILLPIGADSSQLESIYEAMNDKSYILHGPPGTGKSQTITNIIANALYRGKRVLFVAEKMAALSVVKNRLKAIGLAPFCLELYSNKTQKSMILTQLKEASEVVKFASPEDFRQEAIRLHGFRSELNAYINALHHKHIVGLSIYDAITRYLTIENETEINFPAHLLDTVSPQTMTDWQDTFDDLVNVGKFCGHPHSHPFNAVYITEYSAILKEEVKTIILKLLADLPSVKSKIDGTVALFDEKLCTKQQTATIVEIVKTLLHIPELTPALLTHERLHEILDDYKNVVLHGKERDKFKESILTLFAEEVLSLPARRLLSEWNTSENKWFLPKYFKQRNIKKQLSLHASGRPEFDVKNILNLIIKFQEEDRFIAQYHDLPLLFGRFAGKGKEDWTAVEQIITDCELINRSLYTLTGDITEIPAIKRNLASRLTDGIALFKTRYEKDLLFFIQKFSTVTALESRLREKLRYAEDYLYNDEPSWIDSAIDRLQAWLDNLDRLKDWYQWLLICNRMEKLQLGFVADEYRQRNIPTEQLQDAFYKGFYHTVIQYIIARERTLEMFKGKLFNEVIAKYKSLAVKFETLARRELYAKLAANIPSFAIAATQNSEVGILQRSIRSNGRGLSIRKLFDQIPILLSRLCPCMLMSPISVAQYIDADADKFDLVVFDEASQMPTSEAIGAIARGKNIVIVGDPKQLPPTTFFSTNTVDEEHIEMEDLESILDDCLALAMPSKHLLWHYRSRHESLIAFSNAQYYDNKLFTFPSPDNIESKVRFVHIPGCYDKGKSRQNTIEAQAVVQEITRRLSDETLSKKSIGVVTFSSVQQTLIEDMISELFVNNPEMEKIAYESSEPLFIKNLENVQGDERDIILFSVGYGPDAAGRVSMNFGPLNRLGGERRLNVAVSRARYEMTVYSSLLPEMIDLNRTSAVGVAGLKSFLEYAQKGKQTMLNYASGGTPAKAIEDIIAGELRQHGYEVHTHIGASGYRINIGIVDSHNPSRYILGILCDGDNYWQTKTASDREIVQYNALRLLGWNIHRIWTMDWWENRREVLSGIIEEIEKAQAAQPALSEEPPIETAMDTPPQDLAPPVAAPPAVPTNRQPYVYTVLMPAGRPPDSFFAPENEAFILAQISKVIETEAPVSRPVVCKRVLKAWRSRMGRRIDRYFETLFRQLPYYRETGIYDPDFFWLNEEQYRSYRAYRPESTRDAPDLPPLEIANGIRQMLSEQISLPAGDLIRVTIQLFGFSHAGIKIDTAMYRGIHEAIKRKYIVMDEDRIVIDQY
ncbi:MAG: DUF3320 domain-containing protein [Prevotellaceae bacterium]|jgi:hypothetical protein|nr:DUF3320 domain-containing protein [Prevotellaceae bacterium]